MKLFLMLNRISHSFALLTCETSWSTLEISFIFLHIHVLFSLYFSVLGTLYSRKGMLNYNIHVLSKLYKKVGVLPIRIV